MAFLNLCSVYFNHNLLKNYNINITLRCVLNNLTFYKTSIHSNIKINSKLLKVINENYKLPMDRTLF